MQTCPSGQNITFESHFPSIAPPGAARRPAGRDFLLCVNIYFKILLCVDIYFKILL